MKEEVAHLNWVRADCFQKAMEHNKFAKIDKIIRKAKEIERYVLDKKDADVIQLVDKKR